MYFEAESQELKILLLEFLIFNLPGNTPISIVYDFTEETIKKYQAIANNLEKGLTQ